MTRDGSPAAERHTLPVSLILAVFLVACAVGFYCVGVKGTKRSAFIRWRPQIASMLNGEDAYTRFGFPTPPAMALILRPFTSEQLPAAAGMLAWLAVKVALTLVALRWLILQQRDVWRAQPPDWVSTLALLATATPIIADLTHGNINLWILFLAVAAWHAFATGRKVLAGVVLSLAVACKVTPALFMLYFLWKREWKLAAAAGVGLAFWLFVFPVYWLGWEGNLTLLDRWSGLMLKPYLIENRAERDVRNQSFAGLFQRLTAPPRMEIAPSAAPEDSSRVDPPINVVTLTTDRSNFLWRLIVVSAVAGLWWVTRRPTAATDRRWLEHEFALVLLAMLLLSERSWKHHYVTLLPSFVALFAWITARRGATARRVVIALAAAAAALVVLTSQDVLQPLAGEAAFERFQARGPYTLAALLLIACHLIVRHDLQTA